MTREVFERAKKLDGTIKLLVYAEQEVTSKSQKERIILHGSWLGN